MQVERWLESEILIHGSRGEIWQKMLNFYFFVHMREGGASFVVFDRLLPTWITRRMPRVERIVVGLIPQLRWCTERVSSQHARNGMAVGDAGQISGGLTWRDWMADGGGAPVPFMDLVSRD
jgi:hypothetical protein